MKSKAVGLNTAAQTKTVKSSTLEPSTLFRYNKRGKLTNWHQQNFMIR